VSSLHIRIFLETFSKARPNGWRPRSAPEGGIPLKGMVALGRAGKMLENAARR